MSTYRSFPEGFLWGTATSSFQVEMGRGEPSTGSDWYAWVHDERNIREGRVSGFQPEDGPGFWELYPEDLRLARRELGNNAVRLSLDWSRIFPTSTEGIDVEVDHDSFGNVAAINIGEKELRRVGALADHRAVRRYRDILSMAGNLGLRVMLTLYHWPLPLWLHDPLSCRDDLERTERRGWLDQRTIVEFAKYSAFAAATFGDLVDLYLTINEPSIVSKYGYLSRGRSFPPGLNDPGLFLTSMRNLSIAHGAAYRQVKWWDESSATGMGPAEVGIVAVLEYFEPENSGDARDVAAAKFNEYLWNEWCLNSVLRGDYDMNLDGVIQPKEHLPHLAKGCDFIGVDHYLRQRVRHIDGRGDPRFSYEDVPCRMNCSDSGWEIHPPGLRAVLDWAYRRYRRPIYVTENGVADSRDVLRERYITDYLEQLHLSIVEDGVPVRGYFHWSLTDNYSWFSGFKTRYGLFSVDMDTKKRTPTKSVSTYYRIATKNMLLGKTEEINPERQ